MGLDIFAFVMEVEETFGVRIADEDAEDLRTAGDLHHYLREQRDQSLDSRCLSSATFYRLRQALCDQTGVERREIAPGTSLASLFPAQSRRASWRDWQVTVLPVRLPGLVPP